MTKLLVHISILQADIDEANAYGLTGARCNGEQCALNRAAERAFGVPCRTQRPYIMVGDSELLAWLPTEAREFVWRFDMGHPVSPIEFDVEDPR